MTFLILSLVFSFDFSFFKLSLQWLIFTLFFSFVRISHFSGFVFYLLCVGLFLYRRVCNRLIIIFIQYTNNCWISVHTATLPLVSSFRLARFSFTLGYGGIISGDICLYFFRYVKGTSLSEVKIFVWYMDWFSQRQCIWVLESGKLQQLSKAIWSSNSVVMARNPIDKTSILRNPPTKYI